MRSAAALRILSGNIIYNFGTAERLRAFRCTIFTGRVVNAKRTAVQRTTVLFILLSVYLLMASVPKAVSSKWLLYSSCISLMSERVSSAPAVS